MKTSSAGINLIKTFEGFVSKAYVCPAGVLTLGYGHTKGVKEGDVITKDQAEALLISDLKGFEEVINACCDSFEIELNQNQFDALVSFIFNVGAKTFLHSTLADKLEEGDFKAAADEFLKWNKGGAEKKEIPGLTRRREAERRLFLAPAV